METDTSKKEARQLSGVKATALKFVLLIGVIPLFFVVRRQFRPGTADV